MSTLRPIPLTERMPDRSDCDSKGQCWWFLQHERSKFPTWAHEQYRMRKGVFRQTHWLPTNALPVPADFPLSNE